VSCLVLNVPWQQLPCLQSVGLHAAEIQFDIAILGLTQLPLLQSLSLLHSRFVDAATGQYFGVLMYQMALEAPHVVCELKQGTMSEYTAGFNRKLLQQ